jgi:hypothetical protein
MTKLIMCRDISTRRVQTFKKPKETKKKKLKKQTGFKEQIKKVLKKADFRFIEKMLQFNLSFYAFFSKKS